MPLSRPPPLLEQRLGFRQCLTLGFQVHGQVLVSGVDAGVPQPVGDGAQANAGTQQMDGGTVTTMSLKT